MRKIKFIGLIIVAVALFGCVKKMNEIADQNEKNKWTSATITQVEILSGNDVWAFQNGYYHIHLFIAHYSSSATTFIKDTPDVYLTLSSFPQKYSINYTFYFSTTSATDDIIEAYLIQKSDNLPSNIGHLPMGTFLKDKNFPATYTDDWYGNIKFYMTYK